MENNINYKNVLIETLKHLQKKLKVFTDTEVIQINGNDPITEEGLIESIKKSIDNKSNNI
ncbi:MAG: hypothetical protein RLZZ175_3113 [Bacteroidota bacterium]|jgi:hypothetical protein